MGAKELGGRRSPIFERVDTIAEGPPRSPPDLSVVIAAHNEERRIGDQLSALAEQDWPDHSWEVIVVDNSSTDRTIAVAKSFADRLPQLRVIPANDRAGAAYARNAGVAAARSDQIAMCDADDIVGAGWIAAIGGALERHELVTGVLDVDRLNPAWLADSRGRRGEHSPGLFHGYFPVASAGNLGLNRAVWESIGGFSEHLRGAEDIHFSMEAWRRRVKVHIEPKALLYYRFRDDASSLWRQGRSYGDGRATVCKAMRQYGYSPRRLAGWRSWLWLVARLPSLRSREGRLVWLWVAASRLGQLEGSIRNRSLFI